MNTKTGFALGSLILLASVALVLFGLPAPQGASTHAPAAGGPLIPPGMRITRSNPGHPVLRRLAEGEDHFALYRELIARGDGESLYLAALIESRCAGVAQQGLERLEAGFVATLKPTDPNRAARLDAFRQLHRPCAGFSPDPHTAQGLRGREALLARSAASGYLPAIVEMRKRGEAARPRMTGAPPGQGWVIEALESGDALAMHLAFAHIAERPEGYTIVGRVVEPADREATYFAWHMLVCESGYPCAWERPDLSYCAYSGVCGAATLEEIVQRVLGMQDYAKARIYKLKIAEALQARDYRSLGLGQP